MLVRDSYGNDKMNLNGRTLLKALPMARIGRERAKALVVIEIGPVTRGE